MEIEDTEVCARRSSHCHGEDGYMQGTDVTTAHTPCAPLVLAEQKRAVQPGLGLKLEEKCVRKHECG